MKNFNNLFINDSRTTEQYCFVIDNQRYHRFNGKYALYEYGICTEKKEYAERNGNKAEAKQVYGIYSGCCPACGHRMENVPVVKQTKKHTCFCELCCEQFVPSSVQSIVSVLDLHVNRSECIDYESIELDEQEKIEDFVEEINDED